MKHQRVWILFAFALAACLTLGSSRGLANKALNGKLTVFNGTFICDCTIGETNCSCID